jgi:hypothetical protein
MTGERSHFGSAFVPVLRIIDQTLGHEIGLRRQLLCPTCRRLISSCRNSRYRWRTRLEWTIGDNVAAPVREQKSVHALTPGTSHSHHLQSMAPKRVVVNVEAGFEFSLVRRAEEMK